MSANPHAAPGSSENGRLRRAWERLGVRIDPYLILVLLLAVLPAAPLLQNGYFWDAHDARHDVYFLFELDRGIRDGILYPRWQPDFAFGYGYPFFNIYGPLSSYLGEGFHLLGFGFTAAVKIVFGLSLAVSGLAMYGFVRRAMGRRAALVAAVAYMVIPYRLVDIYVRAALAETVAYALVPLVLWAAWAAIRGPRLRNVLGLGAAYAALIVAHPLTALLLTVVLVFYVGVLALGRLNKDQPFRQVTRESILPLLGNLGHVLLPVLAGFVLGLGLSAFFLLPAVTENRFVRVDQWYGGRYAWGGDFVEFYQLFSPRWGFGASTSGPDDALSFQLGVVPVVLSLVAVVGLGRKKGALPHPCPLPRGEGADDPYPSGPVRRAQSALPSGKGGRRLIVFFAGMAVLLIFLMLRGSSLLWEALPLARLAQFPWRLLALVAVALAFLSGAVFYRARRKEGELGFAPILLVSLLMLGSLPYMQAQMSEREVSIAGLMQFQQSSDEMTGSTAWVKTIPAWSSMADYYIAGKPVTSKINYKLLYAQKGVQARTLELRTNRELIEYLAPEGALITFDTFYYPGWRAYLIDQASGRVVRELAISQRGDLGLITVEVPAGLARVLLRFEDTPVRRVSKVVSWLAFLLFCVLPAAQALLRRPRHGRSGDDTPVVADCAEAACGHMPLAARSAGKEGR